MVVEKYVLKNVSASGKIEIGVAQLSITRGFEPMTADLKVPDGIIRVLFSRQIYSLFMLPNIFVS